MPVSATRPWRIQPKLEVGATADPFEAEADRVADQMTREGPSLAPSPPPAPDGGACGCGATCDRCAGGASDDDVIRRAADPDAPPPDDTVPLLTPDNEGEVRAHRAGGASGPFAAPPEIEGSIARARGGGQPLDRATRASFKQRLGHDLGRVRIHADEEAGALAHDLQARAFTLGNDIFFARGRYQPGSSDGRWLLAHELAHVVQQSGGAPASRVQRDEADTQAQCPSYVRWDTSQSIANYNCAGLAFRTYTNRASYAAERTALDAGTIVACGTACPHGQVKHWYWDYDTRGEVPELNYREATTRHDFHTVAGVSTRAGADPNDVYTKNGFRPVHGPGSGASHRPATREVDRTNDANESPRDFDGHPIYKLRENMQEVCACLPCPSGTAPGAPKETPPKEAPPKQTPPKQAPPKQAPPKVQRSPEDGDGSAAPATALSAAPLGIYRAAGEAGAAPARGGSGGLIVEDGEPLLAPGEMNRGPFFGRLRAAVCATAQTEMERIGQTAEGCPMLEHWLTKYERRSAAELERALRLYAPDAAGATSAEDYIGFVTARLARGIASWAQTGRLPADLPEEAREDLRPGGVVGALASVGEAVTSFFGGLGALFKAGPGGVRAGVNAQALAQRLGPGRPLDATPRDRMEGALGARFTAVRLHVDARADAAARALNATAFTVGHHIAFSAGTYRPGEPDGDALLAHELAHVIQQGGGSLGPRAGLPASPSSAEALPVDAPAAPAEREADGAALDAMHSLWAHRFPREAQQVPARDPEERKRTRRAGGTGMRLQLASCFHARPAPQTQTAPAGPPPYRVDRDLTLPEAQARRAELISQNAIPTVAATPAPAAGTQSLRQAVTGILTSQQLQPAQVNDGWLAVQRALATTSGQISDDLATTQRIVTEMLQVAERLQELGQTDETNSLRAHAQSFLYRRISQIIGQVTDRVVAAAIPALRTVAPTLSANTETELRAALASTVSIPAFSPDLMVNLQFAPTTDLTVQFRDRSRRALLQALSDYRDTVRGTLEAASETTFGAFYTADAAGIHQESLIAADLQSRLASAPTSTSAGHLQFRGDTSALLQTMLRQIYQLQATSPIGYRVVTELIAGAGGGRTQRRDVLLYAVGPNVPGVLGDSFASSRVDPTELTQLETTPIPGLPNTEGASYAHILAERQYDAINATVDWAPVAAAAELVQADAEALLARSDCPPALRDFFMALGSPAAASAASSATQADLDWAERVRPGFLAHARALGPLVRERFNAAHNAAVGVEYTYYTEQGLPGAARGATTR